MIDSPADSQADIPVSVKETGKETRKEAEWHKLAPQDAVKRLKSSVDGLDTAEAKQRLARYGHNELKEEKPVSRLQIFLAQFKSFLVIILIAATIFSAAIGEIIDAIAILVIVVLNGVFGYIQEYRAEKTIAALKKLTRPETIVLRDGRKQMIPSRDIVPGDIVILEQGSRVTADMRLLWTTDLKIDESALTGESVPVVKDSGRLGSGNIQLADMKNMAWAGTMVTYGRGKAVVVGTGMRTEIGRIAHIVKEKGEDSTPLQKNLDSFGKRLGIIILGICALVIVIGIVREGLLAGMPITEELVVTMIITGIALAVAAIPEGLPAVVTITLALGLQRLARNNALMRKLPAVETLGSTTVICTDKTGTLTKNEMTVRKIWVSGRNIAVGGEGYEPEGEFEEIRGESGAKISPKEDEPLSLLLKVGALCNNAHLEKKRKEEEEKGSVKHSNPSNKDTKPVEEWKVIGDPTEGALVVVAAKAGMTMGMLNEQHPRAKEIPFSSERAMMTTTNKLPNGKLLVCVKGAPEKIITKCTKISERGLVKQLMPAAKDRIIETNRAMTSKALRVLALAYKEMHPSTKASEDEMESKLIFLGLVGMIDPPRDMVKDDIALCKKAGIKVVMITGDHQNTAMAIAREIGIMDSASSGSITGKELDNMSASGFVRVVDNTSVYARVSPEHKVKIVEALHKKGHIVAMTGDGVNDAPALKGADIGIAMGIKGTDVAKEASDMVLRDDNFSSIVDAVEGGRGIYDNIKKFIQYLLSSNVGEVLIVFVAMLIGMGYYVTSEGGTLLFIPILGALQLLWVNILTDLFPALALGVDPPSPGIMERRPRSSKERILNRETLTDIMFVGVVIAIGTMFLFWINIPNGGIVAATVAFTAIVVFEMVRVQAVRLRYRVGLLSNKKLIIAMAVSILLQLIVVYLDPILIGLGIIPAEGAILGPIFNTVALGLAEWGQILGVAFVIMVIMWLKERFFGGYRRR